MSIAIKNTRTVSIMVLLILSGIAFLSFVNFQGNADNLQLNMGGGTGITMEIPEIEGYSQNQATPGHHQLLSLSLGVMQEGSAFSGDTRRRGTARFSDISILKETDAASSQFMIGVAKGVVYPQVTISFWTTGESSAEYLRYELTNVQITSYQISGSSGSVPVESITLNFEQISVMSWELNEDGSQASSHEESWNVESGEK